MYRILKTWLPCLLAALVALPPVVGTGRQRSQRRSRRSEIEQLVAPIALYPDALVAQILMATTYPLEVVSAARLVKENPGVKDKALEDALQKQSWDPSVKSLAAFPQVLAMLNEKLDMTQKLGDAFLGQQKEVLDAVQRLRAKAQAAGNLKTSKEQTVETAQEAGTTVIKIEPANPQVVYVPTYNPATVYGPWPYPAYPPVQLLSARLRARRSIVHVRRWRRYWIGFMGRLQLGARRRQHQRQQVQQFQQDQYFERQLAAQRRTPQGRASIATVPASGKVQERDSNGRAPIRAKRFAAAPSRAGRTSRAVAPIVSSETAGPGIAREAQATGNGMRVRLAIVQAAQVTAPGGRVTVVECSKRGVAARPADLMA